MNIDLILAGIVLLVFFLIISTIIVTLSYREETRKTEQ